jgi:hypothetical protein
MNSVGRLVWTAALLLAAHGCGDDASDSEVDGDSGSRTDGGGAVQNDSGAREDGGAVVQNDGGADSGAISADAGDGGETSSEMAQALKADGVRVDPRRVELVIAAVCRVAVTCGNTSQSQCTQNYNADWTVLSQSAATEGCRDAYLDYTGCLAGVTCDGAATCDPLQAVIKSLCPPEFVD